MYLFNQNRIFSTCRTIIATLLTWAGILSIYLIAAPSDFKEWVNEQSYGIYLVASGMAGVFFVLSMNKVWLYLLNAIAAGASPYGKIDTKTGKLNNTTDSFAAKESLGYTFKRYVTLSVFIIASYISLAMLKDDFEDKVWKKNTEMEIERSKRQKNE